MMTPCSSRASVTFLRSFGSEPGPGQLLFPYGIAIDRDGVVYVSDQGHFRVSRFTRDGTYLGSFGSEGSGPGQISIPIGLAIDSTQRVLVLDYGNGRISVFERNGTYVTQWGSVGIDPGQFAPYIRRLAVSGDGLVHVPNGERISAYTPNGDFLFNWADGALSDPSAITQDHDGMFYILNDGGLAPQLQEYWPNYTARRGWGSPGSLPGQFSGGSGLAIGSDFRLYCVNHNVARVDVFYPGGTLLDSFGSGGSGPGEFRVAIDAAIDDSGHVYVVDLENNRIQVFDPGPAIQPVEVSTPFGWPGALTPTSNVIAPNATPASPTLLVGDSATTYVHWGSKAILADSSCWSYRVLVDGVPVADLARCDIGPASHRNEGPYRIAGGWHTLRGVIDPDSALNDPLREDNAVETRWLWRPPSFAAPSAPLLAAPPLARFDTPRNCSAVSLERDLRYGWLVAFVADSATDAYSGTCYSDYVSPTAGLSDSIAGVTCTAGVPAYISAGFQSPHEVVHAAFSDFGGNGARSGLRVTLSDSRSRQFADTSMVLSHLTMPAGELAQLFEVRLVAGIAYRFALANLSDKHRVEARLFPQPASEATPMSEGIALGASGTSNLDSLLYAPATTGWHRLVVSRLPPTGTEPAEFSLAWRPSGGFTGSPTPHAPGALRVEGPSPNPTSGRCRFAVDVPALGPIEVDILDLQGRVVWRLRAPQASPGRRVFDVDLMNTASRASAGLLLVRIRSGGQEVRRKLLVVR